jgi:hypothetical protein
MQVRQHRQHQQVLLEQPIALPYAVLILKWPMSGLLPVAAERCSLFFGFGGVLHPALCVLYSTHMHGCTKEQGAVLTISRETPHCFGFLPPDCAGRKC